MPEQTSESSVGVLHKALAIQREASLKRFDWADASGVLKKLREELDEIEEAIRSGTRSSYNEEVGDLVFSAVNLARMLAVDPEAALRDAIDKFERRFRDVMATIRRSGRDVDDISVEELDVLWEATKGTAPSETKRRSS